MIHRKQLLKMQWLKLDFQIKINNIISLRYVVYNPAHKRIAWMTALNNGMSIEIDDALTHVAGA